MSLCALCDGDCSGHQTQMAADDQHVQLLPSRDFRYETAKRDGMQSKDSIRLNDKSLWMIKYDINDATHVPLNEWMTMDLVKAAGFDCAEYGLTKLDTEGSSQAAITVKYFDVLQDDANFLHSGLHLLRQSTSFTDKVKQLTGSDDDGGEFEAVFDWCMKDLTLFEAVDVFLEADVENMPEVFRFYVMAEALNHTDCHLGNIGFIRNADTGKLTLSPIYDVNNFAPYGATRDILRASDELIDLDHDTLALLADKCDVDDWEDVVEKMLTDIRGQLPATAADVHDTTWLLSTESSQTNKDAGEVGITDFVSSFVEHINRSLDSLESHLTTDRTHTHQAIPENLTFADRLTVAWKADNFLTCVNLCEELLDSLDNTEFALDEIPVEHPDREPLEQLLNDVYLLQDLTDDPKLKARAVQSEYVMEATCNSLIFNEHQLQNAVDFLFSMKTPKPHAAL